MPITFVNYMKTLVDDVRALTRAEFDSDTPGVATLIGDLKSLTNQPQIVIDPVSKLTDSEFAIDKKKIDMTLDLFCYLYDGNQENGIIRITDMTERLEQLLLNNKKYPAASGLSWDNSFVGDISYGIRQNGNDFLRASRLRWRAVRYLAR